MDNIGGYLKYIPVTLNSMGVRGAFIKGIIIPLGNFSLRPGYY